MFKVYRYTSPGNAQNVSFLLFFMHFHPWITPILPTHIKIIPNSPWNLFSIQSIFKFHIFLQTSFMNSSKIILIWVMTHIQTKYQDFLGFVLNPNSISFHLTMNPTTKGGFHTYLVPCGFLPTLISRNLRLGCNSIKTLDLETKY